MEKTFIFILLASLLVACNVPNNCKCNQGTNCSELAKVTEFPIADTECGRIEEVAYLANDFDAALAFFRQKHRIDEQIDTFEMNIEPTFADRKFYGLIYGEDKVCRDVIDTKGCYYWVHSGCDQVLLEEEELILSIGTVCGTVSDYCYIARLGYDFDTALDSLATICKKWNYKEWTDGYTRVETEQEDVALEHDEREFYAVSFYSVYPPHDDSWGLSLPLNQCCILDTHGNWYAYSNLPLD